MWMRVLCAGRYYHRVKGLLKLFFVARLHGAIEAAMRDRASGTEGDCGGGRGAEFEDLPSKIPSQNSPAKLKSSIAPAT